MSYHNRLEAGRELAQKLLSYKDAANVLVLALPRGGVPVGYEVARALRVPLDVFLVRKLSIPGCEELTMGAIACGAGRRSCCGNSVVINCDTVQMFHITRQDISAAVRKEQAELLRRQRLYRGARPAPSVEGRTVILVDDGLETGSTMQAAVAALKQQQPARIIVAVPVAEPETYAAFRDWVDEVVCVSAPTPFYEVSHWYKDDQQITDQEVRELLLSASGPSSKQPALRMSARSPSL